MARQYRTGMRRALSRCRFFALLLEREETKVRAEGERAKACEIAAKLIAAGMSKEEAAEFVGIEEEEI